MTEVTTGVYCSANCSVDDDDRDFWQETGHIILMKYVAPVVIIIGVCGNLLTLAVMFTKKFRKSASSLILGALALADTGLLVTGLLRWWIFMLVDTGLSLREENDASCKAHTYFTYFFSHTSPAFLVIMTVERTISVFYPLKCKEICSRIRIFLCIIFVIVLFGLVELFIVFTFAVQIDDGFEYCGAKPGYEDFWNNVWHWIDSSLAVLVPFILILVGNTLIVFKLHMARRRRLSIGTTAGKQMSSVTVMLIAVSICFLVLNLPSCVYFIGSGQDKWPSDTLEDAWNRTFFYDAMTISYYTNTAINFIMYCLTGSKFRGAVQSLFVCCACKCKMYKKTSKPGMKPTSHTDITSLASNDTSITQTQL